MNNGAIARLNADGSLDGTFQQSIGGDTSVYSIAVQPDGRLLISGDFTAVNGANRKRLARLNTDGSLDNTFNPGTGADKDSLFFSLALQADGKVLIGGDFTVFNGVSRNNIARLNADGSVDSTFDPVVNWGPIVMQPDGKLLLGGIVRVNADWSVDAGFNTGTGTNLPVYSVALQPNGKVLIGGELSTVDGTNRSGIARLNSNGSLDSTFVADISPLSSTIWSIAAQPDGKVLVGGEFSSVDGTQRR